MSFHFSEMFISSWVLSWLYSYLCSIYATDIFLFRFTILLLLFLNKLLFCDWNNILLSRVFLKTNKSDFPWKFNNFGKSKCIIYSFLGYYFFISYFLNKSPQTKESKFLTFSFFYILLTFIIIFFDDYFFLFLMLYTALISNFLSLFVSLTFYKICLR